MSKIFHVLNISWRIILYVFQDKPSPSAPTLHGGNLPEHHFKKRYFNEEYQRQQQKETQETRDIDRAREVAHAQREHRERDAHAQREHRERQMQEQARRQSEYERSLRPPGPGYHGGHAHEDQRGQRPGPQGYNGPPLVTHLLNTSDTMDHLQVCTELKLLVKTLESSKVTFNLIRPNYTKSFPI